MIGAIIGAGLSAAGSIFGAIQNRNAMREYNNDLKARQAANEAWYERRYNEDPLSRASAMRLMTEVGERIKRSNRAAAGTQAVMGGTEESVATQRAANAQALADTAGHIAAQGDARRDAVENDYMKRKDALDAQQSAAKLNKAQNIATAVQGVTNAAGAIAGSLDAPKSTDVAQVAPPDVAANMQQSSAAIDDNLRRQLGSNYGISITS